MAVVAVHDHRGLTPDVDRGELTEPCGVERYAMLAAAVSGRKIAVAGGENGRAYTDGQVIYVPDGDEQLVRATIIVQASLLAARPQGAPPLFTQPSDRLHARALAGADEISRRFGDPDRQQPYRAGDARRSRGPQEPLRVPIPAGDGGRRALLQLDRVGQGRRCRACSLPPPGRATGDREPRYGHLVRRSAHTVGVASGHPIPSTQILRHLLTPGYTSDGEHLLINGDGGSSHTANRRNYGPGN